MYVISPFLLNFFIRRSRTLRIADSHLSRRSRHAPSSGKMLWKARRTMITGREDRITRAADCPSAKITIARYHGYAFRANPFASSPPPPPLLSPRYYLQQRDATRRVLSFPCAHTRVCRASAPFYRDKIAQRRPRCVALLGAGEMRCAADADGLPRNRISGSERYIAARDDGASETAVYASEIAFLLPFSQQDCATIAGEEKMRSDIRRTWSAQGRAVQPHLLSTTANISNARRRKR